MLSPFKFKRRRKSLPEKSGEYPLRDSLLNFFVSYFLLIQTSSWSSQIEFFLLDFQSASCNCFDFEEMKMKFFKPQWQTMGEKNSWLIIKFSFERWNYMDNKRQAWKQLKLVHCSIVKRWSIPLNNRRKSQRGHVIHTHN